MPNPTSREFVLSTGEPLQYKTPLVAKSRFLLLLVSLAVIRSFIRPSSRINNMLEYPGLGLDLRHVTKTSYDDPEYPMGISRGCRGAESDMLFVREVVMMIVMDRLTDKAEWHRKVFDEEIVAKWTEEALALPVEPFYKQIAAEDPLDLLQRGMGLPKTILDRGCMEYVRPHARVSIGAD